jgi:hypothetical protein
LNLSSFLDEIKRRVIQILSGIIFQMKKLSLLEFFFLCCKDLKFIPTSNYFNSSSFLLFVLEKGFLNYFFSVLDFKDEKYTKTFEANISCLNFRLICSSFLIKVS